MHVNNKLKLIIEYIDIQQNNYVLLLKSNKKIKKEVEAILTATTILKIKVESLL